MKRTCFVLAVLVVSTVVINGQENRPDTKGSQEHPKPETVVGLLIGYQNNSPQNVVNPQNAKTQQGASRPEILLQPANQNADRGKGDTNQDKDQKVSIVSIPEVRTEQRVLDWLTFICTLTLAVTAIFGTCYALQTLRAIQHEATIAVAALRQSGRLAISARKNADAALLNARAVIDAERPFIFVYLPHEQRQATDVRFTAKNDGRTPAKIVSCYFDITYKAAADHMPSPPTYGKSNRPFPEWLAVRDTFPIPDAPINRQTLLDANAIYGLKRQGFKVAVFWGKIVYKAVFESPAEYETCFCYFCELSPSASMNRGGPEGYNRQT